MDRSREGFQARQNARMREARESRERGDCQRCGHAAGSRETTYESQCDWSDRHQ